MERQVSGSWLVFLAKHAIIETAFSIRWLAFAVRKWFLPNAHPANCYAYAAHLWRHGKRDDAVFWFYVGELRYRFHLRANPGTDPSGDPALLGSLHSVIGRSINLYAGADPQKWTQQIDAALRWDAATRNGFTSKAKHKKELEEVRAEFVELRHHIATHGNEIKEEREQKGIGEIGVVDGVYIEELTPKMPSDWPALAPHSSLAMIAGVYAGGPGGILGHVLFEDQREVVTASSFQLRAADPDALLVVAKQGDKELCRRTIAVRREAGAVVFEECRTAAQAGLREGSEKKTVFLRVNEAGELVVQRGCVTEGTRKSMRVKLSYCFWNREKRLPGKKE